MSSHFFAYISKMRWILRWGMKRNAIPENVMEHSFEVASIAYTLAEIRNRLYLNEGEEPLDANAIAVAALFHDASEVLTGDLPSPIKYHNAKIRDAYKEVERTAEREILATLPEELQPAFEPFLLEENIPPEQKAIVKAADMIAAYLKCTAEVNAGNPEFDRAQTYVEERLEEIELPEVKYFREVFLPSFSLTLDEIITPGESITGH
ncbi:MAG: 5'-deoxynucleotidase [Cellvibrionaceae bacterium]